MHGLELADYLVVAVFLVGLLLMGARFARKQESTEEYFVAGRRMPWLAVGLSTLATLTSTITYLAFPGEMIKNGVGYLTNLIAVPFTVAFLFAVTIPFLMRLRLTSAYEYLELRFDYRTRLLGAGIFSCIGIGWMATVVYTASAGMAQMTGWPLVAVVIGVGAVGVAYTTMGGIRADIWTDVIQAVIMFVGALFTIGFVAFVTGTGPAQWWHDAAQVRRTAVPVFDLNPMTRVSVVGVVLNGFFWHICTASASQVAMQRFFTMPSVRAARRSVLVNGAANVLLNGLLALCGIALFSFYLHRPGLLGDALDPTTGSGADLVFPHFIAHELPSAAAGLLIAALLAAAMSTLDSGVNSLSAVLTVDVFRRRRGAAPEGAPAKAGSELRLARGLTLGFGSLITLLALGIHVLKGQANNILDILPAAFNWGVGPLGGLFFAGMFLPRATARCVFPAALAGAAVALTTALLKPVFGVPFTFAWVIVYSCLTTFGLAALLSLREPKRSPDETLTWRAVVRRPETDPGSAASS